MRIVATFILVLSGLVSLCQGISGIGVALRQEGEDIIVQAVLPDSPASASKAVHSGDRIIAIAQGDGQPVQMTGLGLAEAARLIRGPKGSVVHVTIVPSGKDDSEAQVIRLVRGELKGVNDRAVIGDPGLQLWFCLLRLGIALAHL
jgi:C-terminal processing protease CtpA/Prc